MARLGEQQRAGDARGCGWGVSPTGGEDGDDDARGGENEHDGVHGVLLGVGTQTGRRSSA